MSTISGTGAGDSVHGTSGNDLIEGQGGQDTIDGGAGNDTIWGGFFPRYSVQTGTGTTNFTGTNGGGNFQGSVTSSDGSVIAGSGFGGAGYFVGDGDGIERHTHTYTREVPGARIRLNWVGPTERLTLLINGVAQDLNEAIRNGHVGFEPGTAHALDSQGRIVGTASNAGDPSVNMAILTILRPFTSVALDLTGPGDGVAYEIAVNTNASPTADPETLRGGDGADVIYGEAGADLVEGGAGNDTFQGGAGNDTILFGSGDNVVYGGDGNDSIDDVLGGVLTGNDQIFGGLGNDTVWYGDGQDTVYGGSGSDSIDDHNGTSTGTNLLFGGDGTDTIRGAASNDTIYGGNDGDLIEGRAGNDSLFGGNGLDTIFGGDGNDTIGSINDDGGDDLFHGDAGNDVLDGGGGNDTLFGGTGDDTLVGGVGADSLVGGDGSDAFLFTEDHQTATIQGGEGGTDLDALVFYNWLSTTGVSVIFTGAEQGNFAYQGGGATGTFTQIEGIQGSAYADTIDGAANTAAMTVDGGGGADVIDGGAGSDALSGGTGNDTVYGGDGTDTIYGGDGSDVIDSWNGSDLIFGGAGNDTITPSTGADTLYGDSGNDRFELWDNAGAVSIFGGSDADTLAFMNWQSQSGTTVTFTGSGAGTFSHFTGAATGSFAEIEGIEGTAFADSIDGSGSGTAMQVDAGDGADTVIGGSGNDALSGGTGNDSLIGGAGNDSLTGGAGNDRFIFTGGFGADTIEDFDVLDSDGDGRSDDQLDVSGYFIPGSGTPIRYADIQIAGTQDGDTRLIFPGGETVLLRGVAPADLDTQPEAFAAGLPCFARGTPILTPDGERPVEDIRAGDLVMTQGLGAQPVIWAGHRHLGAAEMDLRPDLRPVHVPAGAIGNRVALRLSPQHAVAVQLPGGATVLVRARHLGQTGVRGVRVARGVRSLTYHHLLLPRHAILSAAGAPAESFYPGPQGLRMLTRQQRVAVIACVQAIVSRADASAEGAPLDRLLHLYGARAHALATRADLRACGQFSGAAPALVWTA